MKKIKIKYIVIIANIILSLCAVVGAVFAWYTNTEQVANMEFDILQIDSLVAVYSANDSNYNGVPDLSESPNIGKYYKDANEEDESEAGYYSYSNCYYSEKYAFKYVSQKYALEHDSTANLLDKIYINNIAPSQIYCYKFEITNYSSQNNDMSFSFDSFEGDISKLKDFEVRLGVVSATGAISFNPWCSFVNENNEYSAPELISDLVLPDWSNKVGTGERINGRKDLWLQVRLKPTATASLTNFSLPNYRVTLSVEINTSN